jgi:hypothetical protein
MGALVSIDRRLIAWLLETGDPPTRYRTLTELLGKPVDDLEVCDAKANLLAHVGVADLLAAQKPAGYWAQRDYYIPKHYSTFWVLSILADLGLTNEVEAVRRGVDTMFAQQRTDGGFCRWRRLPGKGWVWEEWPEPCTQARIVRFLIQFGYGGDARTRQAMTWLLASQRTDGMWLCSHARGRGCLRATLDFLRAAALDAETAAEPATKRAAAVISELLLQSKMERYHVGDEWAVLVFPYFGYGIIPALDALARLGYTPGYAKVAAAVDYLLSRRLPDGSWPLDERPYKSPLDFGPSGEPNQWLTLEALLALKRLN